MGAIHYEAVQRNGDFQRYETLEELKDLKDFFFLVKKEEKYSCMTYSHYDAQIINQNGGYDKVDYKGFIFRGFKITGQAAEYRLELGFDLPLGLGSKSRTFLVDISYNHYYEAFSTVKTEWGPQTQYKDILTYFDNLEKYGVEAYDRILELEREAYRHEARNRREKFDHENYVKYIERMMSCVKEFYVPDTIESIWSNSRDGFALYIFDSIERVFLPATMKRIESLPFLGGNNLKQVFCLAETPPTIGHAFRQLGPETELYVPKSAIEAYQKDEKWSKSFTVIKGF